MIRTAINSSAPFLVGALGAPILADTGLYSVTEGELGKTLLIIMALAVIVNQVWTVAEKIIERIKTKPTDLTGLAGLEVCEERHKKIDADLRAIREDNTRQDKVASEHFQTISAALVELRHEITSEFDKVEEKVERQTTGIHKRTDDILRAVSRLEGKVNQ